MNLTNTDNFSVQVSESKDGFICYVEELHLISKGSSLQEAFDLIETQKKEYFENIRRCNLEHEIPKPNKHNSLDNKGSFFKDLRMFGLRSLVVGAVGVVLFSVCGVVGGISFKKGLNTLSNKVDERSSVVRALSEEEKMELFKKKLDLFSPYLKEIKKVINE